MTAQTVESVTTSTDQVVIVEQGKDLARILANVLPCAGKDDTLPILTAVHVDVTADRITVAATDRYTLATDYIERGKDEPAWPAMSFNLAGVDTGKIVKLVKAEKISVVPVTLTFGGHGRVSASTWSGGITSQLVEGQFPDYTKLMPSDQPTTIELAGIALNPANVARFGKVFETYDRKPNVTMRLTFTGDHKPVMVSFGGTFRGLIMPVRIDS